MDDRYYTIKAPSRIEIKVKGSRFISESELVTSAEEARAALERIRKREHSASHHCYAYRVGLLERVTFKYSDGGEPSGTAGRPIHDLICGHDLTNVLLVVTRYFGGTKLGTGGLVRAYGEAARLVIDKSGRRENFITESYRLEIGFSDYDRLAKILHKYSATRLNADFSRQVSVELEVRKSKARDLITEIVKLSGGKARIEKKESA